MTLETKDLENTGICKENGMDEYLDPLPFITKCGLCQGEIKLLKDSTEGMRVYHGDCWSKLGKEIGVKCKK